MFRLNLKVLVWEWLALTPHVPLAEPDPHPVQGCGVDAVAGRDDPALGDEGAAAADPLAQKALLDDGHLPGVPAELRVLTAHDPVAARVDLTAFCRIKEET